MYAKRKGFDPLLPENWYSFSQDDLLTIKVRNILHKNINIKIIIDVSSSHLLFPLPENW
jgi:hypothetical protein